MSENCGCKVGLGRAVITPRPGVSLAGYFNARPNKGALDDLQVKVFLVACDGAVNGLISYDLCILSDAFMSEMRAALSAAGYPFAATIPLAATHTHTGPDVGGIINEANVDAQYAGFAAAKTLEAVRAAMDDLAPAELCVARVENNPFAFNRRYWMKDGRVVTNPGKLNPDIVKPEGPIDPVVGALGVKRNGELAGLIVNLSNHTDSTGGDWVSADWPGHMERTIQANLNSDLPVITLISPAGNINHFDVSRPGDQCSPGDAKQIGEGYGEIVCAMLGDLKPVACAPVRLSAKRINIPFRQFTDAELDKARATLGKADEAASGDLTSEDLARGSIVVEKFFAQQLLDYVAAATPQGRDFDLAALAFGQDFAIVFLPGEPFVEIAMAIREQSPFKTTFVCELANGECGYVCMTECYERGGYEILPVLGGGPAIGTCDVLIEEGLALLKQ